jgi:hypothetical protein
MAETVTQTRPLKEFKKIYRQIGRTAPQLYKKTDSKPFAGDRVADFNKTQSNAFGMLGGVAQANTEYSDNMLDQAGGIAGGTGMAAGMNKPLGTLERISTGQNQIGTAGDYGQLGRDYQGVAGSMNRLGNNVGKFSAVGDYKDLAGVADDEFYSERNLDDMARGRYVDGGNPYLKEIIRQSNENVQNSVNARMAGSGAYGGSRYASNMTRELVDAEERLRYQNYEAERGRQMQANQMMDAAMGQRFGQQATATQGLAGARTQDLSNRINTANAEMGALAGKSGAIAGKTNVQGTNIANQAGAASQYANMLQQGQANRLAAMGLSPQLQQASFLGGQAMLGIGDRMQAQEDKEIQAEKAYYEEDRDQDWTQLAKLGAAGGMASQYGNSTQTQNASFLEQLLGIGAGVGGLAGSLFGTGGIF